MRIKRLQFFTIGLIVGAVVGVAGGIMIAPSSGGTTRRELAYRARQAAGVATYFADRAEGAAELLGRKVEHYLGRDQAVAWRRIHEIREGVQRYTQAAQTH